MRAAVRDVFYSFNAPLEGEVNHLYVDVLGLVSIGVGHLVDPIAAALQLPLKRKDGTLATRDEIIADFAAVKNGKDFARLGYRAAAKVVKLHLTPTDLEELLHKKLAQNDAYLANRFPAWETYPADCQLAIHSLAWGCGPAFRFPKLEAALRARDFRQASGEVRMVANGVELYGLKPRNAANRALLLNAAHVEELGLDLEKLWWPRELETEPLGPEDETQSNPPPEPRTDPLEAKSFNRFDEALEAAREFQRDFNDPDEPPDAA